VKQAWRNLKENRKVNEGKRKRRKFPEVNRVGGGRELVAGKIGFCGENLSSQDPRTKNAQKGRGGKLKLSRVSGKGSARHIHAGDGNDLSEPQQGVTHW